MNKTIKYSIFALFCIVIFFLGFIPSEYGLSRNNDYKLVASAGNKTLDKDSSNFHNQEVVEFELSKSDASFLEKHIYGQWRFSERLFILDQENNMFYDTTSNFSEVGVEEIKKSVVVYFSEDSIDTSQTISQTTLSNARDMYLFSMYGGFRSVLPPEYYIETIETNIISLVDIYYDYGCEVQLLDVDNFIKVTHRASGGSGFGAPGKRSYYSIANTIYVNPNDTNTIYVDFCGLWKMERDDKYYGTGGKSEY